MAQYMRVLGRLAGRAIKSHAFDRAITVATGYILSEMRLTDVRAKRALLKRKRGYHIYLLGRTVYRLYNNEIEPIGDERTERIIRVIEEIDREIQAVEEELERRRAFETEKRKAQYGGQKGHYGGKTGKDR